MSTVNHMDESEGGPVAEDVRRRIVSMLDAGTLRPGDRLGSEREMAEHFSVSRATLRNVRQNHPSQTSVGTAPSKMPFS